MIRIILSAIMFLISFCAFSQYESRAMEAEFNGRLCNVGRGLCDIKPPKTNTSKTMKNYTTFKQSDNTMIIELDLNNLSVEDQKKFFGKEYSSIKSNEELNFVQESDFVFSTDTLTYLGFDLSYKNLRKGNYPIAVNNNKISITLTLSTD